MHDWTLNSITIDWQEAAVVITFRHASGESVLTATGFTLLRVPKQNSWGPSHSVNDVIGPVTLADGMAHLTIEMQSGDHIEIEAELIQMPEEKAP